MKRMRNEAAGLVRVAALGLSMAAFGGCMDAWTSGGAGVHDGEVGVQLNLGSVRLTSLRYSMANSTHNYQGTLDLGDASALLAVIGGIAAGPGYVLALSGTTSEGAPCQGLSQHFDVISHNTAVVPINVRCQSLRSVGSGLSPGSGCPCDPPAPPMLVVPTPRH